MKNIVEGIRNLLWFLPVVWRFRPWDYAYSYRVFLRALEAQEVHFGEDDCPAFDHDEVKAQIAGVRVALLMALEGEGHEQLWDKSHEKLALYSRGWWS